MQAALYVFVFMWTPSLERRAARVRRRLQLGRAARVAGVPPMPSRHLERRLCRSSTLPSLSAPAIAQVGLQMGHGLVFAIFMLCKMAGSQGFHLMSQSLSPSACLQVPASLP